MAEPCASVCLVSRRVVLLHALELALCDGIDGEQVGDEHAHQNTPDQIPEHRHQHHRIHQGRGFSREPVRSKQKTPIDDVQAHFDQDSCKKSRRNGCGPGASPQQHDQQNNGVGHA